MHSGVPAATWLVTPPLGMMNNLNVAIISTKLYFPFGGKWTGQGVFRQASRSKMRNRPIYHDKMDSRSPWSIITNICYSYTICVYRVSSVAVQYERRLHTYVGWFAWLLACPWLMGFPDRVPHWLWIDFPALTVVCILIGSKKGLVKNNHQT